MHFVILIEFCSGLLPTQIIAFFCINTWLSSKEALKTERGYPHVKGLVQNSLLLFPKCLFYLADSMV
jgi:hypothetical protein